MNVKHRKMLSELCSLTREMGGQLDYTSTSYEKLKNRQRQLANVAKVLYGVLCDEPENEYREDDMKCAKEALIEIKKATEIVFPDRNGLFNNDEINHPNKYDRFIHDT